MGGEYRFLPQEPATGAARKKNERAQNLMESFTINATVVAYSFYLVVSVALTWWDALNPG